MTMIFPSSTTLEASRAPPVKMLALLGAVPGGRFAPDSFSMFTMASSLYLPTKNKKENAESFSPFVSLKAENETLISKGGG